MKKKNESIYWIIGILLFLLVATKLPIMSQFAIVQKTTCASNTISYWGFENNLLDLTNMNSGNSDNPIYISGKIGNSIRFDTTNSINFNPSSAYAVVMWINNYSSKSGWYFVAKIGDKNYVNGALDNTKKIISLGSSFGLGFNGSVDEMATFSNLSYDEMINLYNSGSGREVCYVTSHEENISCAEYALEMSPAKGHGCLNYSGDFFPNCEYSWEDVSNYEIINNKCEIILYCQDSCTETFGCYSTEQRCKENLKYNCYVLSDNVCSLKTDYNSCVIGTFYKNISSCESKLPASSSTTTTTTSSSSQDTYSATTSTSGSSELPSTFKEKLNSPIGLKLGNFEIKTIHLIALLIVIIAGFILFSKHGKTAI